MIEPKSQQEQSPQEIQQSHQKLKNDYANIFKVCFELEEEKKEHNLVIDEVKEFLPERKCWRLVGGVLIEKTVGEVVPALKQNIELLDKAIEQYQIAMNKKEKEILDFEQQHNLKNERKTVETQYDDKKQGVLA